MWNLVNVDVTNTTIVLLPPDTNPGDDKAVEFVPSKYSDTGFGDAPFEVLLEVGKYTIALMQGNKEIFRTLVSQLGQ